MCWKGPGSLARWAKQDCRGSEGFFQPGSKGTNPLYMSGFPFQLERQDLSPKGLNVNKNTILQKRIHLGRKCNPTYRTQKKCFRNHPWVLIQRYRSSSQGSLWWYVTGLCPQSPHLLFLTARCLKADVTKWPTIQSQWGWWRVDWQNHDSAPNTLE